MKTEGMVNYICVSIYLYPFVTKGLVLECVPFFLTTFVFVDNQSDSNTIMFFLLKKESIVIK